MPRKEPAGDELAQLKRRIEELEREKAAWAEMEVALKESETQYRALVEKSQIGIFIDDRDGDFIFCNERIPEIFGMTMEEFISQHPSERIVPEDYEKMRTYHNARMNGEEAVSNYEIRGIKKDGSIIDLSVDVVVIEEDGKRKGTMSYIRDITEKKKQEEELRGARDELERLVAERTRELEAANAVMLRDLDKRKRVEKALRESEDYYRRVIETLHDALLIFDPEGEVILDANQRACEMYGYSKSELIGRSLTPMTKDKEAGKKKISTTLEEGHYNNFETTHFRKDGSEVFLEVNASVVDFRGKEVLVTVFRDRTADRDVLESLRESEQKYRMIFERASDGILVIQDSQIKFANPRLAEIAGTSQEGLVGRPFTDFVHPDEADALRANYERRMAGEVFDSVYRTRLKRADGTFLNAEINAGMVPYDGRPADLVFVREIAREK